MLFKKMRNTFLSVSILSATLLPLSVNIDTPLKEQSNIAFYSNENDNEFDQILNATDDNSFGKIRKKVSEGKIKLNKSNINDKNEMKVYSDENIKAYPLDLVESDVALQKKLADDIRKGDRIYLYGPSLTINKYSKLLNVPEILKNYDNNNSEKKLKERAKESINQFLDTVYEVIGYTLNADAPIKLFFTDIQSENKLESYMFLRSILDHEVKYLDKQEEKKKKLISTSTASAAASSVASAYDINWDVYHKSYIRVKVNVDWTLYRMSPESEADYDYFSLSDNSEVTTYNDGKVDDFWIDHDIPYDEDDIQSWSPADTAVQNSFTVSLYPISFSYTFNSTNSFQIDEEGSQTLDYGRWDINPRPNWYIIETPFRVTPGTQWRSKGTYAAIDIRHRMKYRVVNSILTEYLDAGEQWIPIRYDY